MDKLTHNWPHPENEILDAKDRQILYQLDLNARQTNRSIAKKVRLSKEVVGYRIKRMIDAGIISGFYALIDLWSLGYTPFRIYLKLRKLSYAREKKLHGFLKSNKSVWWFGRLEGSWNLAFHVAARDPHGLEKFWDEFMLENRQVVKDKLISVYTKLYHFPCTFLVADERQNESERTMGAEKTADCDSLDVRILEILARDARASLIEIAKKTGTSPALAGIRIKKMEERKIILGYRPVIDLNKLGYEYYKIDFNLENTRYWKDFADFSRSHPNVSYIDKTVGGTDFEVDVYAPSSIELQQFIDELRARFPNAITDYEYFRAASEEKKMYLAPVIVDERG